MEKEKKMKKSKLLTIIGMLLCIFLSFFLACNLYIIIQGAMHPDTPPALFGKTPLIVLSGSMSGSHEGHLEVGDLILVDKIAPENLKKGDVIAFDDGNSIVTHRIYAIQDQTITTKGDANNTPDSKKITPKQVIGIVTHRFAKIGDIAMFVQTPVGMLIFIGIPFVCYIIYDVIVARKNRKKRELEKMAYEKELEELRALKEKNDVVKEEK